MVEIRDLEELREVLDGGVSRVHRERWCAWAKEYFRRGESVREFVTRWTEYEKAMGCSCRAHSVAMSVDRCVAGWNPEEGAWRGPVMQFVTKALGLSDRSLLENVPGEVVLTLDCWLEDESYPT